MERLQIIHFAGITSTWCTKRFLGSTSPVVKMMALPEGSLGILADAETCVGRQQGRQFVSGVNLQR